ncbi:MAG: hypothetical protein KKA07_18145 [Bacteroidetes bacterium]|nr:hypothetical protein [Bacteroidota bacterium]MBU1720993.1 hypothetical protein [Bacteroidota bacterium]
MWIANPIYDAVFKYMLDDNKVAKLLLSAIIGEDIDELECRPQEVVENIRKSKQSSDGVEEVSFFSVYRIDFSAKIKTPEGFKLVIIEVQKAKYHTDIMRFRRYLGNQYSNPNNSYMVCEPEAEYRALPIISIYFLGHKLNHTKAPVIKVHRKYYDATTNEEITTKEEFIESLTHDSFVIQIPFLKEKRRNEMELLLSIFDQTTASNDIHILNVDEGSLPEKFKPVIRRLQSAVVEQELKNKMILEDDIIEEMKILERTIEEKYHRIEKLTNEVDDLEQKLMQKDQALSQKDQALSQKDQALSQKDQALSQKDQALKLRDQELSEKDIELYSSFQRILQSAREMKKLGVPLEKIAQISGISKRDLEESL